jgi:serine/threonine protein kinase
MPSSDPNAAAPGDSTLPPVDPGAIGPPPAHFEPGYVFGRYRIGAKLGAGGMGAVYLAHDTVLDRPVAIKVPRLTGEHKAAAARFVREAQAAAALRHPNICPIYDVGQVDGTHFLSMAFVKGEPLSARVGKDRPFDPDEAARVVRTVALAMQYAHDQGVIHRDLKPANILLDDTGQPVVMDFGLARRQAAIGPQLTIQGELLGTPAYMPPEQAAGDLARMGPASDVYSLGAVLYELLTGRPPFTGDLLALLSQIALDSPPRPSARRAGVPPRFDAICLKALAKNPADRWKSMPALAEALAPGTQDGPTLTLRVEGTPFAYRPPPLVPVVTVGRQRRKPGDGPDQGNDFVLRVAGNDALSARISRRHFEVRRTATGFAVVDRSKAGLTRNGAPVPKDVPVELADGDRLGVAGVVALLVDLGQKSAAGLIRPGGVVEVPAPPAAGGGQMQIEASVGDLVTLDD